jgi:hypothetical protein
VNATTRRIKLREAQRLVAEVRDELQQTPTTCASCGTPHYDDWTAHLFHEALTGISERLENTIRRFLPE